MAPEFSDASRRVIVDADACPFKADIFEEAARAGVEVILVSNPHHEMPEAENVRRIVVDHRDADAADFAVANECRPGDVAITQDSGLAAMVLARGALALSPRGAWYRAETIDAALERRHLIRSAKRQGKTPRRAGPPPISDSDRLRLRRALAQALASPDFKP